MENFIHTRPKKDLDLYGFSRDLVFDITHRHCLIHVVSPTKREMAFVVVGGGGV